MTPGKLRRLANEYQEMLDLRAKSSLVRFAAHGDPPTRYEVTLTCRGLIRRAEQVFFSDSHQFDIVLDNEFPVFPPAIQWRTPIFHPNFRQTSVCLGDHWYASWSVAQLCVALCEMVQYKTFNIYDPLDTEAAIWLYNVLRDDPQKFPIDGRSVLDLDFSISPNRGATAGDADTVIDGTKPEGHPA